MSPDLAFALAVDGGPENEAHAIALAVLFGQFEGGEWDWDTMTWRKQDG